MQNELSVPSNGPGIVTTQRQNMSQNDTSLRRLASRKETAISALLVVLMAGIYIVGRHYWDERYYVPDEGLGYLLGLTGGIFMLIAFSYGLLKRRLRAGKKAIVNHSLRVHMFFGIVGCYLVLIHSAFHIGSLNGGIALVSMVLVFLSGVIGRYLYSRVHYGLDSKKADINELRRQFHQHDSDSILKYIPKQLSDYVLSRPKSFSDACWRLLNFRFHTWIAWRKTKQNLMAQFSTEQDNQVRVNRQSKRQWKCEYRAYITSLRKIALFSVYERFFFTWRHAHVPLLYLLFVSGIAHVVAVHMY